ncbi:WD40 repeat-like protein, partial [Ceratobasidium sp. AG-I]
WGSHLVLAERSPNLLDALYNFLSLRLLLWIEIMNLKRCISTGVGVLRRVQTWLQGVSSSHEVQELALDAWRFALEFSTSPMSHSTPHIYMSALPFWPDNRPVSKYYFPKMRGMTKVTGTALGVRKSAPLAVCITRSPVKSIAYSFDSTRMISGSSDGTTIRIWDTQTGQMVGKPLEGHTGPVASVAYSHDGTRIVSGAGDNTVRIWDTQTGQVVGKPLEGHTRRVTSVAYLHDDTRIVSGSDDETIRIWGAQTGQMMGKPLEGHTRSVTSVAYSHDGA